MCRRSTAGGAVRPSSNTVMSAMPTRSHAGLPLSVTSINREAMTVERRRPPLHGVGIGYHPFLHRTILARPDRFDFVELPLDAYVDEAQRTLLDPDLARVGAIGEARPCLWRGTSLSLGSAVTADTTSTESALRRLVDRTGAILLREDIAVRRVDGRDLGLAQPPPLTEAMADLVGRRCEALASRLPCGFAAGLSLDALSGADRHMATAFVRRLAAATDQDLAFDLGATAVAAGCDALLPILSALPAGRFVQIALTSLDQAVWPVLDAVLAATGARSVLIRRTRNLFPLDEIHAAVERAREALDRAAATPRWPSPLPAPAGPTPASGLDLAATARDQSAFAERCLAAHDGEPVTDAVAAVRVRAVWRERIADLNRTKQLERWAQRPATWRV